MQTNLQVANNEELRHAWAFAAHPKVPGRPSLRRSVITACSRQAKLLGVRA
jgi:hypothetical protein